MSEQALKSLAVIGAGSWGTALSILFARNGVHTTMWGHLPEHMQQLRSDRANEEFLPGVAFPDNLEPCIELQQAMAVSKEILVVVPSHVFVTVLQQIKPYLQPGSRVAWATKGLESGSARLLHESAAEILGKDIPLAVISGPTFAKEVAQGLPTAVTIASNNPEFAQTLAATMHNETFRAYTSTDIIGVELGGSAKNVLAIAAGIADGLGFGANTRAALITRGLAEIMRLGIELGGEAETFMGLAGMGDLVLTCTDNQSRNRRFGIALAQGKTQQQAMDEIGQVVEGIKTTEEVHRLAERLHIDMPITQQVYQVLYNNADPHQAVHELFARELKPEFQH
jgi:glycerol-3-phosphate dehydrogenase (NAD(P)+)